MAEILAANPSDFYRYIGRHRRNNSSHIDQLRVGDKIYSDDSVSDGFFDAMSNFKKCDFDDLLKDPNLGDQLIINEQLLLLLKDDNSLPPVSMKHSEEILMRVKKNVRDFNGITALHYLHAGESGLQHFNFLLNSIIQDVNLASLPELNTAYGLIFYKGHSKQKSSHRSYRTISTCPFLSKCIDLYLRDLYHHHWDAAQATTQFQGSGSNHELASLLVTEVIQHSLYVAKRPVYLLALDAQSAFDRCIPQILSSQLFRIGLPGAAVKLMNNRLRNRKTVYEWNGTLMGPADDDTGVEQGGINSSDLYKLYNNRQLDDAQGSGCGVDLESCTVTAVGQADDVLLVANDVYELQLLCRLTESYCKQNNVILEPTKTKLLQYALSCHNLEVRLAELTNNVTINDVKVPFNDSLEHVGVIREKNGNLAHILQRIAQHKRSLASILFSGAAKSHRGNPSASIRMHNLYCLPVLLSGLGSLVLTKSEESILDKHFTQTILRLQKLFDKTPKPFVHLFAGVLPFSAHLALRRLSLFHLICLKQASPLNLHARHVLTLAPTSSRSWFIIVRDLCQLYGLEHPLKILDNPPSKASFKKLIKLKVVEYWQHRFAQECSALPSLKYFDPTKASLISPHPVWKFAGPCPYEVNKSIVVAKMISGRYRTEALTRHWSEKGDGYCSLVTCDRVVGDLEHLLVGCPALQSIRNNMFDLWEQKLSGCDPLYQLFQKMRSGPPEAMSCFLLNPAANPELIHLNQTFGPNMFENALYLTRTFVYSIHREKLKLTGKWTFDD